MPTRRTPKPRATARPAKLSPPRLGAIQPRPRLFKLLDRERKHPIVWIEAPAGAGKTTLAASYLIARRLRTLWYQIDTRDADPAAFFYYLRLAVQKISPRKTEILPLLTPEHYAGLAVFTRNFFEEIARRLPSSTAIVFDNYQDVPENAPLHALLAEAVTALPRGISLIVLSRAEPPPAFARLRAHGEIARLGWDEVRLTRAELAGFVRAHRTRLSSGALNRLYERTDGWAAGVRVVLESGSDAEARASESLFDYFAAEILRHAEPALREFLFSTALLPQITVSAAEALTDNHGSARILADLTRRNFFTVRRTGPETAYEYHPLFREYLLHAAAAHHGHEAWVTLKRRTATLLIADNQFEHAARLMHEAGDTPGLAEIIAAQATTFAAQGRLQTLEYWLRALPAETLEHSGWLSYWFGICRLPFDLIEARAHLERAYAGFQQTDDSPGLYLAWAGVVETFFYQWDDYAPLDRWLDELERLRQTHPLDRCAQVQPRVVYAALSALGFIGTGRPELSVWVQAGETLLTTLHDPNLRVLLAAALCLHCVWIGDLEKLDVIATQLRTQLKGAELAPVAHFHGYFALAEHGWITGDVVQGERWLRAGFAYGERLGIRMFEPLLCGQALYLYEVNGDEDAVARTLERMRRALDPRRRLDLAHYRYHATWLALARGEARRARDLAEQSLALAELLFARFPIALNRIRLAETLVELAEFADAHRHLDAAGTIAARMGSELLRFMTGLVRAWAWHRAGCTEEAGRTLAATFALGQRLGYRAYPGWNGKIVAALCAQALARGIEPDYARRLIRERGLVPPDNAGDIDTWPWPVKVYALGCFDVRVDERPLPARGKQQRKPLDLAKLLVSAGPRGLSTEQAIETLWPEQNQERSYQSYSMALHRLRKRLGTDECILAQDGRVLLNPRRVWVDAWAFEQTFAPRADTSATARLERAVALYKGAFLGEATAEPWGLAYAERLYSKYLRAVLELGQHRQKEGAFERAIELYQNALEHDDLQESLYQRLLVCYGETGRRADGQRAYERCRKCLQEALGVSPSAQTETLRARLLKTQ